MTGDLSLADEEGSQVVIEESISVYRDPDRDGEVVAATDDQEVPLGIIDQTVSRMEDGSAPVVVKPTSEGVDIRNKGNRNDLIVSVGGEERSVPEGSATHVSDTATVDIGHSVTLEVVAK